MKVIHSRNSDLKHPFAYHSSGFLTSISDAILDELYYLDSERLIPMVNAFSGERHQKHWRLKPTEITYRGQPFKVSSETYGESWEHQMTKLQIMTNGFVDYGTYRIKIKNAKEEFRIENSKFRSDITAELTSGERVVIEVVKTSDLSDEKRSFINKNQVFTIKIYIDKHGNQQHSRTVIVGNSEIDRIKEQKEYLKHEIAAREREVYSPERNRNPELDSKIRGLQEEIERVSSESVSIQSKYAIAKLSEQAEVGSLEQRVSSLRVRNARIGSSEDTDIRRLEDEIESLEREINRYAEALSGEAKPAAGTDMLPESRLARTQLMDAVSLGRAHKLSDDHIELVTKASITRCGIEWGEEMGREFETFLKQNQK